MNQVRTLKKRKKMPRNLSPRLSLSEEEMMTTVIAAMI